ncbi:L,D-transpeptidase [Bacillus sp. 2205SS5-2]|uniref:L,D-transpeptidase n=1 Tax=Bacillus sp. 2205SS5-2 TaxID=3109031 RepID=UPI0030047881
MLFAICLVFSPIWPLGENPLPGDPIVIVNKQTNELAFIVDEEVVHIYSVATGKTENLTPEGTFTVTVKAENPFYRKKNIEGGSPDNPLGTRWIGFDAEGTDGRIYGLHGTNAPNSIGQYLSNGCIRLSNTMIEQLYEKTPLGTKVHILSSPLPFEQIAKEIGAIS